MNKKKEKKKCQSFGKVKIQGRATAFLPYSPTPGAKAAAEAFNEPADAARLTGHRSEHDRNIDACTPASPAAPCRRPTPIL